MDWIVFSYSLPSKTSSTPRVALWRRLRRLGAVTLPGSIYLLPDREECAEAFQWLAQEIRQAQGEAAVMHVRRVDGLTDQHLVALFQAARKEEYDELNARVAVVEQQIGTALHQQDREGFQEVIEKLRRLHTEIERVDYFICPDGARVAERIASLTRLLMPDQTSEPHVAHATIEEYKEAQWVTRPRPHVDRLACAWLIRRYINPHAVVRYALQSALDEVTFDMAEARFGHLGNLCTFEVMIHAFRLENSVLRTIADIVHEIDLRDGLYVHSETAGIDAVLGGWRLVNLTDAEREVRGIALFEGLYAYYEDTIPKERQP